MKKKKKRKQIPEQMKPQQPEDETGREEQRDSSLLERKRRERKMGKRREKKEGMLRRKEERGRVTGTPAAMADSSFCLHLSFPVTVPSSCFSGYETEGRVTNTQIWLRISHWGQV